MAAITRVSVWMGQRAANTDQDLFFQDSQQLGLAAEAQVANLVEEQRAAGCQLELAGRDSLASVKRPARAEQFALGEVFGMAAQLTAMKGFSRRRLP